MRIFRTSLIIILSAGVWLIACSSGDNGAAPRKRATIVGATK